jgi:hypothetical protein
MLVHLLRELYKRRVTSVRELEGALGLCTSERWVRVGAKKMATVLPVRISLAGSPKRLCLGLRWVTGELQIQKCISKQSKMEEPLALPTSLLKPAPSSGSTGRRRAAAASGFRVLVAFELSW